jgi:hypothetical protein
MYELADAVREARSLSAHQLRQRFATWTDKQLSNAITRASGRQMIHNTAGRGVEAVYAPGPPKNWLPDPLPPTSVLDLGDRARPKLTAGYSIPRFGARV